jgi:murein DD-endopeptidase MepM/ murein hydrolase activator NlpD
MQLIWIAGPAGKVVKLAITTRTVGMLLAGVVVSLVVLGFVFHWIGLRVAIEHAPQLAHRLGGVTSQSEQDKIEATYRAKLEHLDQQLLAVSDSLKKLEETKNQVLGRVGLNKLLSFSSQDKMDLNRGQGGPLNLLPRWGIHEWRLDQQIDQSLQQAQRFEKSLAQMQIRWEQDLGQLHQLPTQLPVSGEFLITSSFGFRVDPFTRLPGLHEGIDFVAPVGTPVLSTAAGEVIRAEYSGAYGNLVELAHKQGFVTRYAHLKTIDVQLGDQVAQHAVLGSLGNTGRSTGPHLHYEVLFQGRSMHPAKAMSAWARD